MLSDREDACVLWDIRVSDGYKNNGIGQKLLDMGISGAKVDMNAYYFDADIKDEIQMVWYLDI